MTRDQAKKLGTIIAKIEALQYGLHGAEWDTLQHSKVPLLKLWSRAIETDRSTSTK